VKIGDLVRIKEHYHLQLGQNPIGLVLNSSTSEKNGIMVYEVQLFGAYADLFRSGVDVGVRQRIDQFKFYGKDLEVVNESR